MQVKATELGYGGIPRHQLRQPGEVFEVRDGSKDAWYEPVKGKGKKAETVEEDDTDDLA